MAITPIKKPITPYVPKNESASGIAAALIQEDNDFTKAAATKGLQAGNARGMLNSSISTGSGVRAALDYATPLAQQEASQNFQANRSEQELQNTRQLQNEDNQFQLKVQDRGFGFQREESALDRQQQLTVQDKGIAADGKMQAAEYNFREAEASLDRDQQKLIASLQLDAGDKQTVTSTLTSYNGLYESAVANINANPDLSAKERVSQITAAKTMLDRRTKMVENLFSIDVAWGS